MNFNPHITITSLSLSDSGVNTPSCALVIIMLKFYDQNVCDYKNVNGNYFKCSKLIN
jgi:hypothetical protein